MPGAREYPKIIAERERSSVAGCWHEFLRLAPNTDGSVTLAVCRYEALASAEEFVNEKGELNCLKGSPVKWWSALRTNVSSGER